MPIKKGNKKQENNFCIFLFQDREFFMATAYITALREGSIFPFLEIFQFLRFQTVGFMIFETKISTGRRILCSSETSIHGFRSFIKIFKKFGRVPLPLLLSCPLFSAHDVCYFFLPSFFSFSLSIFLLFQPSFF